MHYNTFMKKIFVLFVLTFFVAASYAAGVSKSVQNAPKGVHAPRGNSYYKSILHTNEGIKGNYQIMKSQNSTGLTKPTTLTNTVQSKPSVVPSTPIKPAIPNYRPTNRYLPALYTYGFSSADDDKQEINIQNNTYNYYSTGATASQGAANNKEEVKKEPEKSLKATIEQERANLKKKYSSILSNKTMSNDKMCSKMAGYFPNADYQELDRVLNSVLLLNCDIGKLRPDDVIK